MPIAADAPLALPASLEPEERDMIALMIPAVFKPNAAPHAPFVSLRNIHANGGTYDDITPSAPVTTCAFTSTPAMPTPSAPSIGWWTLAGFGGPTRNPLEAMAGREAIMPANTAPLPSLTLPTDALLAEIFTRFGTILEPRVNGSIYQIVITNCTCNDRSLYYGHAAGSQTNHIYCVCILHGVQDCGIALRADCLPARSSESQERRRKSGYTTRRWYSQRGM